MIIALTVLFCLSALQFLYLLILSWGYNDLKQKHEKLSQAFVDYANGITKVFSSLRIVEIRPATEDVSKTEAPKDIQ